MLVALAAWVVLEVVELLAFELQAPSTAVIKTSGIINLIFLRVDFDCFIFLFLSILFTADTVCLFIGKAVFGERAWRQLVAIHDLAQP